MRNDVELIRGENAPGAPGIPPKWTSSAKTGVGTALSRASHVWFTLSHGIFNEIYYPRLDHACTRDMGMIVTGGKDFFSEEKRHTDSRVRYIAEGVPGYLVQNTDRAGRYRIEKEVITDPQRDVVLQRTVFTPLEGRLEDYRVHVLLAPHLDNHGTGNTAWVSEYKGWEAMFAERDGYALALLCSAPWVACSAGYVGSSDLWQDLDRNKRMTWAYSRAENGNVALGAEVDMPASRGEFVLALGFGRDFAEAAQVAIASLEDGFEFARNAYTQAWLAWQRSVEPLDNPRRQRSLYRVSGMVIRTHEDKTFPGALTASLSIPWGFAKGDEDLGGYHLAWPRDLVEAASALLAMGAGKELRAVLRYLEATQDADGHWPQNMWLDGLPYWNGIQMDETAFPVLLVDHMRRQDELGEGGLERYWPMVRRAVSYLVRNGPVSPEDRWETDPGYTPFTLCAEISALLAAADIADLMREPETAGYLRETADVWNDNIERWIYLCGSDLARRLGVDGYYVRVARDDDPSSGSHVISPDFLSLVRFGLRRPDDPRILNTIRVVDEQLRVQLPAGPAWLRYNGDPYGEHEDGSPYDGSGIGRAWPLLTAERAHYELAAGRVDRATALLASLEAFANEAGFLPEQLWDSRDLPEKELFFGRPSGSAMPLVWAHAEYVKLLRSIQDGRVFDMPPQTVQRYLVEERGSPLVIWRFNHKLASMPRGKTLRIEALEPMMVRWTADGWKTSRDTGCDRGHLGVWSADLDTGILPSGGGVEFTFCWTKQNRWEGRNYAVAVE